MKKILFLLFTLLVFAEAFTQPSVRIARMKYNGGGDWYASPTALPNLIKYCNDNLNTNIYREEDVVEPGSSQIFNYSFIHLTGHGNIVFSDQEALNLRKYLVGGGFLNINDSYGLDPFIRLAMKKVFPELDFIELPHSHPIYHQKFKFPNGIPKIHEHDGKPPKGYGLIYEGRLVSYYNVESDIGDGWEDPEIHNDPPHIREKALQMGANIIQYVFVGR
jgi:hypothetical protein